LIAGEIEDASKVNTTETSVAKHCDETFDFGSLTKDLKLNILFQLDIETLVTLPSISTSFQVLPMQI
jgi:hypothetical protein